MSSTNLILGAHWGDEWPGHVDVRHEGKDDFVRYVPERTCRVEAMCFNDETSECQYWMSCGHDFPWYDEEPPDYCMWCGARIEVDDGDR